MDQQDCTTTLTMALQDIIQQGNNSNVTQNLSIKIKEVVEYGADVNVEVNCKKLSQTKGSCY